jgi:hypothetical protein
MDQRTNLPNLFIFGTAIELLDPSLTISCFESTLKQFIERSMSQAIVLQKGMTVERVLNESLYPAGGDVRRLKSQGELGFGLWRSEQMRY